ncbi:sensor histidine kinase [Pseudonocardia saturnea]
MNCDRPDPFPAPGAGAPGPAVTAGAVAGIGVLVAATVAGSYRASAAAGLLGLDIAVAVTSVAGVAVALRWPARSAIALAVLAALSPAATPAATLGTMLTARLHRPVAAVAVGAAGVVAHAVQGLLRPTGGLSYGWWLVLVVVAHAGLVGWGQLARSRQALLASLRERARRAEVEQSDRVAAARAQERAVIAGEMHDVLAHRLTLLAAYAGALEYRPDAAHEQLARAAGVVRAGVHDALDDLRGVIGLLRADRPEWEDRPQPGLGDLPRLIGESRAAGTTVDVDDRTGGIVPPDAAGRTAYRIVQEGLTNARKHAPHTPVHIRLGGAPGAELVIDLRNPAGPTGPLGPTGTGTGLVGLTERARLAGGRLEHGFTAAGEFRLHAALPWPE